MSQEANFNSDQLMTFMFKKIKPIAIITGVAFVTSIVVSLMLPVYYKATATVFPTSSNSVIFKEMQEIQWLNSEMKLMLKDYCKY